MVGVLWKFGTPPLDSSLSPRNLRNLLHVVARRTGTHFLDPEIGMGQFNHDEALAIKIATLW